jgi:hypothetical protein
MMVSSAWLGGAPIAGGNGGVVRQGFGLGRNRAEEERLEVRVRPGVLYHARTRLVTKGSKERLPAPRRRRTRRRAVLHARWRG